MSLIASVLNLSRRDIKTLRLTDPYSLHRVVYSLFEDVRTPSEKQASQASGILYADQGGDFQGRKVLILSNRPPSTEVFLSNQQSFSNNNTPMESVHEESKPLPAGYLDKDEYQFQVTVNPTKRDNVSRKLVPIRGRIAVAEWFKDRAEKNWGFQVITPHLQVNRIEVQRFQDKKSRPVTLGQAHLHGKLKVIDREQFQHSFTRGIGRGRSFGCGLLQLVPLFNSNFEQGVEQ